MKCGGERAMLTLPPKSFFDARVRARERAFVAVRLVGLGTLPGFGGGGKIGVDCESGGRWCRRSGERFSSLAEAGVGGTRRSMSGRRRAALISACRSEF
jgi:hypothetical protein